LGSTSLNQSSSTLPRGIVEDTDLTAIDPDLKSENILAGVTVFGVSGNATPSSNTTSNRTLREETMAGGSFILHHE
jgi:hypothetical protein